jgi:hypothetical protein
MLTDGSGYQKASDRQAPNNHMACGEKELESVPHFEKVTVDVFQSFGVIIIWCISSHYFDSEDHAPTHIT